MDVEYEAMFKEVEKEEVRKKLREIGAELIRSEFLQKREIFELPGKPINQWIRLRDEGNKITLTYKEFSGNTIDSQKEIETVVGDFDKTSKILEMTGLKKVGYQENYRELWMVGSTEVVIDSWPFLDTLVEVEGKNESDVRAVSEKLGFDYSDAIFGSVEILYSEKYGINKLHLCDVAPVLKFDVECPFE